MFLQIGVFNQYIYIIAQPKRNQHNTLDQLEENQYNTMDQLEENQSFADFLEQFMPRPLAEFLDGFFTSIAWLIALCSILAFLEWIFGIDTDNLMFKTGLYTFWVLYIVPWCAIFGCLMLLNICRVVIRVIQAVHFVIVRLCFY